jgi:hypothetical protein
VNPLRPRERYPYPSLSPYSHALPAATPAVQFFTGSNSTVTSFALWLTR